MVRWSATIAVLSATLLACKPNLEGRPSLVDGDRVLAVRSIPAEAKGSAKVMYEALYVGTDGALDPMALDWALCDERKPLATSGPVATSCLVKTGKALTPLDSGPQPEVMLSADVCRQFGPIAPAPKPHEPASRPTDPDTTGGYYQPVRVLAKIEGHNEYTVGTTRLDCGLAGATQDQAAEYAKQHRPNESPALASLLWRDEHDQTIPTDGQGDPVRVARGRTMSLRATWAACPSSPECGDGICSPGEDSTCDDCKMATPVGCTGSEPYLELDPAKHALVHRHEAIRVSWFATDGDYDHDRTGRTEAETKTASSDNAWTAPKGKGEVRLWIVIRDDRGGVGWASYRIDVQ